MSKLEKLVVISFVWATAALSHFALANEGDPVKMNDRELTNNGCLAARQQQAAIDRAYSNLIKFYVRFDGGFFIWNHKKYLADSGKLGQLFWKSLDPALDFFSGYMLTRALEAEKLFPTTVKEARQVQKNLAHVLIGDSLIEYFKGYWRKNKDTSLGELTNLGIGGERLENFMGRWSLYRLFFRPQRLTISIGGNNLMAGCQPDKINSSDAYENAQTLLSFLARLHDELPNTKMVLINMPPTDIESLNQTGLVWNQEIKKGLGYRIMDHYAHLADETGHRFSKYSIPGDPIHINNLAYQEVWIPLLKMLYNE